MLGAGETDAEICSTVRDLRQHCVKILTVGQYLRASPDHLAIQNSSTLEEFEQIRERGRRLGFRRWDPSTGRGSELKQRTLHRSGMASAVCHPVLAWRNCSGGIAWSTYQR